MGSSKDIAPQIQIQRCFSSDIKPQILKTFIIGLTTWDIKQHTQIIMELFFIIGSATLETKPQTLAGGLWKNLHS